MSLIFRKCQLLVAFPFRKRVESANTTTQVTFRTQFFDLDENLHMNNGRYINYMEAARWDLMLRTGFTMTALKQKWVPLVVAQQIRYRRSLKLFQKFTIESQIAFWDEKWIFVRQKFYSKSELVAIGVVKNVVLKAGKPMAPDDLFSTVGIRYQRTSWPTDLPTL